MLLFVSILSKIVIGLFAHGFRRPCNYRRSFGNRLYSSHEWVERSFLFGFWGRKEPLHEAQRAMEYFCYAVSHIYGIFGWIITSKFVWNYFKIIQNSTVKGQLSSKGLFKVFICTKKRTKIFLYFCNSL